MFWLPETNQERLVFVLVHFVWQGIAVAGVLATMAAAMSFKRPHARYASSLFAFLLMTVCPIATWFVAPTFGVRDVSPALEPPREQLAMTPTTGDRTSSSDTSSSLVAIDSARPGQAATELPTIASPSGPSGLHTSPQPASDWRQTLRTFEPWIIGAWLCGVGVLSLRLLLGAIGIWRWRRAAELLPESFTPMVGRLCAALSMTVPRVRVCRCVAEAIAFGLFKPMILLPAAWVTELPPDMLEAVIAHELAHLRRLDLWVNLLQRLLETLLFYHPAVWWLSRRLRIERELCCDDLAATVTNDRIRYAKTLEHVARLSRPHFAPALAVAVTSHEGVLLHRVRQLLGVTPQRRIGSAWLAGLMTLGVLMTIALAKLPADAKRDSTQTSLVVEWAAIVSEDVLDELRQLKQIPGKPLPSDGIESFRWSADEVRAVLKRHLDRAANVTLPPALRILPPTPNGFRPTGIAHTNGHLQFIRLGDHFDSHPISVGYSIAGFYFVEDQGDEVGLRVNFPGFNFTAGSAPQANQTLKFETTLKSDEAIVTAVVPKVAGDWRPALLLVHEIMRIPKELQEIYTELPRLDDWVRAGQAGKAEQAARIVEWRKRPQQDLAHVDAKWTHEVAEHGGRIQLVSVSRPFVAPGISWTPEGQPIKTTHGSGTNGTDSLVTLVRVWEPDVKRPSFLEPKSAESPQSPGAQFKHLWWGPATDWSKLRIGAGFGAWTDETKLGLGNGATASLAGFEYELNSIHDHGKKIAAFVNTKPALQRTDSDIWLVAVTKSGTTIEPNNTDFNVYQDRQVGGTFWFDLPKADIAHFVIKARPIQWVEFTDIATEPPDAVKPREGANESRRAEGPFRLDGLKPTPDAIRVQLKLDRVEYLLGENIVMDYEMTNVGKEPAPFENGGYYPDLRINDGFRMSAVKVDEAGKPVGEPVGNWPMPANHGGPVSNFSLKPQESRSTTLFVTRYVRFLEPGRYRLRIENFDRDQHVVYSVGETLLSLKQPTAEQARAVFEQMKKAPRKAYDDGAMKFLHDVADFEALHQPVYLPVLKEFAEQGDLDALTSLERMQRVEANEVLVTAIARALNRDDWQTARLVFAHLRPCLPFPNWFDDPADTYHKTQRDLVARAWRADFSPVLTRLAKRLGVEVATMLRQRANQPLDADAQDANFRDHLQRGFFPKDHPQSLLVEIDYILRCVGRPEDFADCLTAYAMSIELTKSLPLETHQYFRPRGSSSGFRHTVLRMMQRGAAPPTKPAHPGEAAAFAIALRTQPNFRPDGWQAELLKWLKHDTPYLAELILDHLPEPIPAEVFDYLATALTHDYIDLQIAACHTAEKHPRPAFREPLQKILDTAKDKYLRKYAVDAARANGLQARYDPDAPFVDHAAEAANDAARLEDERRAPLEFRVAVNTAEADTEPRVPKDFLQRHYPDNTPEGRNAAKDRGFIWIPVAKSKDGGVSLPVEGTRGEQRHALLGDTTDTAFLLDGQQRVVKCQAVSELDQPEGWAIQVTLDEAAGATFRRLTKTHLNQKLAVIVNGKIIAAPVIRSEIGPDLMISGNFTKEEADQLAAAIRSRGMREEQKPSRDEPATRHERITVTGRALDPEGKVIAGAKVWLVSARAEQKLLGDAVTNAQGRFEFRDAQIPIEENSREPRRGVGAFEICGIARGFGFAWRPLKWYYPNLTRAALNGHIEMIGDHPTDFANDDKIELDLKFSAAARLRGRLIDDAGKPIEGAKIGLWDVEPVPSNGYDKSGDFLTYNSRGLHTLYVDKAMPAELRNRTTDADGWFEYAELPADCEFRIEVRAAGFANRMFYAATADAKLFRFPDPKVETGEFTLTFVSTREIPVLVTYGDTGLPAPNVYVSGHSATGSGWVVTNKDGKALLRMPPGEHGLTVRSEYRTPYQSRDDGEVTVPPQDQPVQPLTIQLERAAEVEVTILDAETKQGLAGAELWVEREHGFEEYTWRSWKLPRTSMLERPRTDANGKVVFFFKPGKYVLGSGYRQWPGAYDPKRTTTVEIECRAGERTKTELLHRRSIPAAP